MARLRIFGVQGPAGSKAWVKLDLASGGPQHLVRTYAEYMAGNVLLFDSGELTPEPHALTVTNADGSALGIDRLESTDPTATVVFE